MTQEIHHLGLSVTSLTEGRTFFVDLLGWKVVKEDASYPSLFVSNGVVMITLWKVAEEEEAVSFDRKTNIGLHHFAIRMESEDALNALHEKLTESKFAIEMPPNNLRAGPARHFFVSGPSGIRMEFIHIPQALQEP